MLIGTHRSFTGEQGKGIISLLVTPFVKTQTKNVCQQFIAGCTLFEGEIKYKKGTWILCHGIWQSKATFYDVMNQLNILATESCYKVQINLTVLCPCDHNIIQDFKNHIVSYSNLYFNIVWKLNKVAYHTEYNSPFPREVDVCKITPLIPWLAYKLNGRLWGKTKYHNIFDFL